MKTNIGIVGYGNLGKAVEKEILKNNKLNLVAIFSRRTIKSISGTLVEPYDNYVNYKGKIDIMILCGGSLSDLEWQSRELLNHFNIINSFDTHTKIKNEVESLSKIAKNSHHTAIISCGWDPGIFSIVRSLSYIISKETPITFWGKGISMGHSDAIRNQNDVVDAIQFTVPNKEAVKLAKTTGSTKNTPRHFRKCFVVSNVSNKNKLASTIKNIPHYFKGQPTTIEFVDSLKLLKLKEKMGHKGEIISRFKTSENSNCEINFSVKMKSNPEFTARIMICYIQAIKHFQSLNIFTAVTPTSIPVSFLFDKKDSHQWSLCWQ